MKTFSLFLIFAMLAIGQALGQLAIALTSPLNPIGYHVSSAGASDGSASADVAGGLPPYSYSWSNGASASSITGLAAGSYSLTVADALGGIGTASIVLTEPPVGQCWTAYNAQNYDSLVVWNVGNAILGLDTLQDDTVLTIAFTCTDSTELYGFGSSFPSTDYISLEFIPRRLSSLETFSVYDSVWGKVVEMMITPQFLGFAPSLMLAGDSTTVYLGDSVTGVFPAPIDSTFLRNVDSIIGVGMFTDNGGQDPELFLQFNHPIDVSGDFGSNWLTGDLLRIRLSGWGFPPTIEEIRYQISGSISHVMLDGIFFRDRSMANVGDTIAIPVEPEPSDSAANDPARYISDAAMDALRVWSVMEDSLTPSIFTFLPQVPGLDSNEVQLMLQDLTSPSSPNGGSCRCRLFRTDVTVESPYRPLWSQTDPTPNDNRGKYYNWSKSVQSKGAAYRSAMTVSGHRQTGEEEWFSNVNSASMEMINICVGHTGYPANCCPQTIKLRSWYDSRLTIRNKIRERRKSESKAAAEDAAVLYTYEWTDGSVSPQILGAKQLGLYNVVESSWNPAFWVTLFRLAGHVADAVVGDSLTPKTTGAIAADIGTLLGTPAFLLSGSPGGDSKPLEAHFDTTLTLVSNVGKVIRLESQGRLMAGGAKKCWSSHASVQSDFMLAVKTMRNPDINCCHNQDARWTIACLQDGSPRNEVLQDAVGGFLFPERPWFDGSTGLQIPYSNFPGKMDIETNDGIALDTNYCNHCVVRESVNLSTGRALNTNTLMPLNQPDPHWELIPISGSQTTPHPLVINTGTLWAAPPPGAQWISFDSSGFSNAPAGWNTYIRKFYIGQLDPAVQLELEFLMDNHGTVSINNQVVFVSNTNMFAGPPRRMLVHPYDLVQGWNELTFQVYNSIDSPHGLAVKAILSACPGVITAAPAPTTALPDLRLHPNPVLGTLHVEGAPPGLTRYTVCDLQGRALMETSSPDMDVQDLAVGMYLLRVQTKGATRTLRFAKQ